VNDYFTSDSYWTIDGRCYFSIYQLQTFIDGMGGLQQAKEALDSLRAKTVAAGRKGIYLNAVDWQIPDNAKEVYKTLASIASPATYGSTKSTSRTSPRPTTPGRGTNTSSIGTPTKRNTEFLIFPM